MTADVSDPNNLALISDVDANNIAGTAIALNGSGLGIIVGRPGGVFGTSALDVVDTSDPTDTGQFITRVDLPAAPLDVALANGLAFVADGSSGLQIVNYIGFDVDGVPPTVSLTVDAEDVDPGTAGTQVLEGHIIHVTPTVADDVQVRNVELLVNGQVAANNVAYPFEFSTLAPTIAQGGNSVTLQVRATDTGGNVTLSAPLVLDVVPDTFPPQLQKTSVAEGASRFFVRSINLTFDEPLDTGLLNLSGITLIRKGPDGMAGTADDIPVTVGFDSRAMGQVLSIQPSSYLVPGDYQLQVDPAIISDLAGNQLVDPIVLNFTIRPASDVRATTGVAAITQAPSANPGQEIGISVPFDPATAWATFSTIDASGNASTVEVQARRSDAATAKAYFQVPYNALTGDMVVYSLVNGVRTDFADGTFPLQIVPVVTGVDIQYLDSDGSSTPAAAHVALSGLGFIDAAIGSRGEDTLRLRRHADSGSGFGLRS